MYKKWKADQMDFCDECGELRLGASANCVHCNHSLGNSDDQAEDVNSKLADMHIEEKEKWAREQLELKKQLILEDVDDWAKEHITSKNMDNHSDKTPLRYMGGVDISFVKGDNVNACAALVILNFPELEVVYEDLSMVKLTAPYIPGYLAFREVDFLIEKVEKLKVIKPELMPQVILVDGNGILHPKGFGLASQLGVLLNIPTIGCAKSFYAVQGLEKDDEHKAKINCLKKGGDTFDLVATSGDVLGVALRSHDDAPNPIFVSVGHKLSLETAVWSVRQCCQRRVPEPTRQADILSRKYLRENFPPCIDQAGGTKKGKTQKQSKKTKTEPSK